MRSQPVDTYRPICLGWRAQCTEDRLKLVHVGLAGEVRSAQHQLREDASDRPDVNRSAVVSTAPEKLGRAVPSAIQVSMEERCSFRCGIETSTDRVITWQFILYPGSAKSRARPKSAIFSCPSDAISKLLGLRSCGYAVSVNVVSLLPHAAPGGVLQERAPHPVQDEVTVAELKTAEGHSHPAFDIRGQEDERAVLNDEFQIRIEELEDEIEIFLGREDVQELQK